MIGGQSSRRRAWSTRTAAFGAALLVVWAVLLPLTSTANGAAALQVTAVDVVGLTVSDMDRALAFYTHVLPFVKVSDTELSGRPFELLTGVFGARSRVVRLRLGAEEIELTEFLAPKGRPIPTDLRAKPSACRSRAPEECRTSIRPRRRRPEWRGLQP
jgi:catechol 2,3-dioxygenase-like lactoylglutathione lyase family enzyme